MSGLARLREVAEAATPGPWEQNGLNGIHTLVGSCVATSAQHDDQRKADAVHIATFDPSTVLALLDVAEQADGLLTHYDFQGVFTSMQAALVRLSEVTS